MAPIIMDCPACARKLRVPDELFGKAVKCPTCDHTFRATDPHSLAAPSPDPALFAATAGEEPVVPCCPKCGEHIDKGFARCRFCGEQLADDEAGDDRLREEARQERHDAEPHCGNLILVLGIASMATFFCGLLGLSFGIAAWAMGRRDLVKMRQHLMDPEGEGLTQAGLICGIIGTILNSFSLFACCAGILFTVAGSTRQMPPPGPFRAPAPIRPAPIPPPGPRDDKAAMHFLQGWQDYLLALVTWPPGGTINPQSPAWCVLVDPRLSAVDQPTPMLRPVF
jgi:hypothetical protein